MTGRCPRIGKVLEDPSGYEADMIIFVPESETDVSAETPVLLLQHGAHQDDETTGFRYLLEIGVVAEVLDGLSVALAAEPNLRQRLAAVLHYAEFDAYPDVATIRALS